MITRNTYGWMIGSVAFALAASSAQAGFISTPAPSNVWGQVAVVPTLNSPTQYTENDTLQTGLSGNTTGSFGYKTTVDIDGDPTVYVFELITNTTASTWNSYSVTVNPSDPTLVESNFVVDTAFAYSPFANVTSFLPSIATVPTFPIGGGIGTALNFSGGSGVAPGGQIVIPFHFDLTDNPGGTFSYAIANHPYLIAVPEPASLGLLGLGGLALLRRRR